MTHCKVFIFNLGSLILYIFAYGLYYCARFFVQRQFNNAWHEIGLHFEGFASLYSSNNSCSVLWSGQLTYWLSGSQISGTVFQGSMRLFRCVYMVTKLLKNSGELFYIPLVLLDDVRCRFVVFVWIPVVLVCYARYYILYTASQKKHVLSFSSTILAIANRFWKFLHR